MTEDELKLRQMANQHLLSPGRYTDAVRDLCGVQAQFLSNALHALRIRSSDFVCPDGLVKSWTLRGTVHVFTTDDLPLFLHEGRARFLRPCDTLEADASVTRARKQYFSDLIVNTLASGIATREELKAVCAAHGMTETESGSIFDPWGGMIRALCESGKICHAVQEKKAFILCPPFVPMEEAVAKLELARRYFTHYGPATIKDAAYFFGTTQAEVMKQLSMLHVRTDTCCGRTYFSVPASVPNAALPACIFLAGFDPLMLGYHKNESLYLPPEHLRKIFNLAGIVMPAVLLRGRVVGKWKRTGTRLNITLFESLSPADCTCIEAQARATFPDIKKIEPANP